MFYLSPLFVLAVGVALVAPYANKNEPPICPRIYEKIFHNYIPQGNLSAGVYTEVKDALNLKECVLKCCIADECNVALMNNKCYHIKCKSDDACKPILNANPKASDLVRMMLVRPVEADFWDDILAVQDFSTEQLDEDFRPRPPFYEEPAMEESGFSYQGGCSVGIDATCLPNEFCAQNMPKSRAGTCQCKPGFSRNREGDCVTAVESGIQANNEMLTEKIIQIAKNQTPPVKRVRIDVNVENSVVKLPIDEVSLVANVTPDDRDAEEKYQYEWTSLQQPKGSTAVRHQNSGELSLSKLVEGLYTFKVTVSNSLAYGETFVNVTVLPPSRINRPPVVLITPANQTIKQPNAAAVLDASSSTDDDGILAWHWELQQGPLGYQPELKDAATLQLNDLTKPGNYTFKLTITDTDKATAMATANVTVLKFTDYPPDANAGEDKIIYLPHNKITLNGNISTDDHAITTWEWTKSADDAQKAVDMQDTRTPYLQLSNLEEGVYTFTLKVTDSAGQASSAQVHVYVKPPTNKPPVADGGGNVTISLPQTWALLDGRNSSDDNKIVGWKWEQVEGPSTVKFVGGNESVCNVTGLTKGAYRFKVSVTDDNNNVASDHVYVVVNQNVNQKPTANAGGTFEASLPINAIMLNGSNSKDDWAITKYQWTRDDKSLAMGNIAEKTAESPILIVTNLVPGIYVFNLTVFDEQGLSDTDTVTFTIKPDPKLYYLIEMTIDVDAKLLTQAQYNTLIGKLALLVIDGSILKIQNVRIDVGSGKAMIVFYLENNEKKAYSANEGVQHLRRKLRVDGGLLGFTVGRLQTAICQNNCSEHGVCVEETRECECEAFWMRDMFKVYLSLDEDSDCSWSILYVVLGVVCTCFGFIGAVWGMVYLCFTWWTKRRSAVKPTIYKLIENSEDLPPFVGRKCANLSDSDTDSDVVFESRLKNSRGKPMRNGFNKSGRRIKT